MNIFIGQNSDGSLVSLAITRGGTVAIFACLLAVVVALHVLMALGLTSVARRQNIRLWGLAWVPFANYYIMGKITGGSNLFGWKVKNLGVIVMILEFVQFAMMGVALGLYYSESVSMFFAGQEIYFGMSSGGMLIPVTATGGELLNEYASVYSVLNLISGFVSLISLFFSISLLLDYFERLVPESYWWYTLIAVFLELTGLMVFLCRKKDPVNFKEYMQNKYRRNFYGGANPYTQAPPDDPYREFAQKGDYDPGDPFAELKPDDEPNHDNGGN